MEFWRDLFFKLSLLFFICGLLLFIAIPSYLDEQVQRRRIAEEVRREQLNLNNIYIKEVKVIVEPQPIEITEVTIIENDDAIIDLLARCVEAEAGNQDIYGKALVVDVVLNRVDDPDFPNTIEDVIYQKNQFEVVSNGMIDIVEPAQDTIDTVKIELIRRTNNDVLYFNNEKFTKYGTAWKKVGAHYFSTK